MGAACGGVQSHLGEDQGPGGEVHPQRPLRDERGVQERARDKVRLELLILPRSGLNLNLRLRLIGWPTTTQYNFFAQTLNFGYPRVR